MANNRQFWQTVLGELELKLSRANFTTWFKNTSISSKTQTKITINVPNAFTKEWLENKYHRYILEAVQSAAPKIKTIRYVVSTQESAGKPSFIDRFSILKSRIQKTKPGSKELSSLPRNPKTDRKSNLNPRYTLENFISGSCNELAKAACAAVIKNPGINYNPLFIYGGVGLGKTHLLQATGNEILKKHPDFRVRYTSSEKFTNELIKAIGNQDTNNFKASFRDIDVLIIDDIQFLAGKEKTQEEFFHTFNELYQESKQIVISSDRPPKALNTLEERLRSRFEGGMIADINPPDLETRIAILEAKTQEKMAKVPREVLNYIATNIQTNIRELEGALSRVLAYSELNNVEPNIENAKNILANIVIDPKRKLTTPKQIIEAVCTFYNIDKNAIVGSCRKKEIVKPRQIAMYLIRDELNCSYPTIASEIGGRDHTTVIHGIRKIEKLLSIDETIQQEINLIKQRLHLK